MSDTAHDGDDSLVEALQAEAGDALRTVTVYDEESYDLLYMREDVDAIYSSDELEDVFDDLRLQGWGRESLEGLFNAGPLECSIFCFGDALMFHFVTNSFEGVFVTFDRGTPLDTERVVRLCKVNF